MKNIFILLIIFLFSCEVLEEQAGPLSGDYYVYEGWKLFKVHEYDEAERFFLATLLADEGSETNYYDYAYAGLGWTAMYKANINMGIDNRELRDSLRTDAIEHFKYALTIIIDTLIIDVDTTIILNINSPQDSLMYANILVGRIFNTGYLALDKAMKFYSDGSDHSVWNEALDYSELVISYSDSFFSIFPIYNFKYGEGENEYADININGEDIRVLRAQSFIRLGDFESAVAEIKLITSLDCNLSQISVIECLHSPGLNP